MQIVSYSYTTLGILYDLFPDLVAELIFKFYTNNLKYNLVDNFKNEFYQKGLNGILKIKDSSLANWIVTYENITKQNHKFDKNALQNINAILLNNHDCLNGWRERTKKLKGKLTKK